MSEIIHKSSVGKIADTLSFVLTDEKPDRVLDSMVIAGLDLTNFKANPVALVHHHMGDFPVGVWSNLRQQGDALIGDLQLAAKGTSRMADTARELITQGILKAVSITFRPIEREALKPRGNLYTKSELLEVSLVSVPMNPRALMVAKSLNLNDDEIKMFFTDAELGNVIKDGNEAKVKSDRFEAVDKRARWAIIQAKRATRENYGEL